ncbi:WecB/TagA/CpsF family glycosyltransferase [Tropicimonas sp. IMCC34011]|uniref:WecB/TagA/CpsF family glycosyltransferase n=1 Tax=Tropicimonas sp. IMCC34011 TaxID=2248759 RepID=UPI000E279C19|nr:WecB/TagA/CpsF family glycosyltransferase [Tropicimonas sp. IMCC34011]
MTFAPSPATFFPPHDTRFVSRSAPERPSPVRLFGIDIASATSAAMIEHLLEPGRRSRVAFLNAHCANVAARNADYADALVTADAVLPDGIGIEIGARMSGQRVTENLNGTDFVPALLHEAARRGLSVFLLGGRPGVASAAADRLALSIPGLRIAGTRDGYGDLEDETATRAAINTSGADILLVALGVPRQDLWLARNAECLRPRLSLGVGALFDFLAGRVRRAPKLVRRLRCEWIWRLAMEPRRMAGRYLWGNAAFLVRALRHATGQGDGVAPLRRMLDIALAGGGLIALAPLFGLVAVALRLDSRGPVFFRQTRIGKDGVPFTMLKFRSMHVDAEARRDALLAESDREGVCFKSRTDPRVTRVGRILRRFSIDELPQILNILRGEMSVVGPRPALPQEVAAYPGHALGRLAVKPGLTGVWQVSGRAEVGFDKMIDMDLAYARSRSLILDILLISCTFRAVFGGRGAY